MKFINKGDIPTVLTNWVDEYEKSNGKKPTFKENFLGEAKHNFKQYLLEEQYYLCAYCCNRVEAYDSHIEHIAPKGQFSNDDLNYYNMVISCNGYHGERENCGHLKDKWHSDYYFISPLDSNCENYFKYYPDGRMITSRGDTRAKETIEKLNINSELLQKARRAAIRASGYYDSDFEEEQDIYISMFERVNEHGELMPFCNAVLYVMKNC